MRADERVDGCVQTNPSGARVKKPYSRPTLTKIEPTLEILERLRMEITRLSRVEPRQDNDV